MLSSESLITVQLKRLRSQFETLFKSDKRTAFVLIIRIINNFINWAYIFFNKIALNWSNSYLRWYTNSEQNHSDLNHRHSGHFCLKKNTKNKHKKKTLRKNKQTKKTPIDYLKWWFRNFVRRQKFLHRRCCCLYWGRSVTRCFLYQPRLHDVDLRPHSRTRREYVHNNNNHHHNNKIIIIDCNGIDLWICWFNSRLKEVRF